MERPRSLVRVLGPIDVLTPGGVVPVGGHQPRALLGALVLSAGHAVGIDRLNWVLWGEDPSAAADATLQSYISHLRGILGHAAIAHTDHSYELDVTMVDIDVIEFERLLRLAEAACDDDPERCWQLSRDAIRLWRGRPFGELADDEAFALELYRLEELRLAAVELSIEADIRLGRDELVIGELEAAVQEHPYREQLWWMLATALAQNGRRVEALRNCAKLRKIVGEVGITVGSKIAELEQEILAGKVVDRQT